MYATYEHPNNISNALKKIANFIPIFILMIYFLVYCEKFVKKNKKKIHNRVYVRVFSLFLTKNKRFSLNLAPKDCLIED